MATCEFSNNCEDYTSECNRLSRPFMESDKPCHKPPKSAAPLGQVDLLVSLQERCSKLETALQDARLFAVYIESLGKPDYEIYKHEFLSSARLSLERIDAALAN